MCPSLSTNRHISRPYSKLNRLCEEAARAGGGLINFAAVATAIKLSAARVTQMFGHGQETGGSTIQPETIGRLLGAFEADGVMCESDWLYLEFDSFAARVAEARPGRAGPRAAATETQAGDWQFTEATVLADLVELRLHPPRPGNELPDSHYVDATLLFGTALCDHEHGDDASPRSVAIALTNARLAIGSDLYAPLQGTMLGERVTSDNFSRVAGGLEITGPAPDGTLEGDPIGAQHLAVIAGTNNGGAPFAVTVAANRRSFVVNDPEAPPRRRGANALADTKDAILNALIYKSLRKDDAGRAVLARATMRRGAAEGSDAP